MPRIDGGGGGDFDAWSMEATGHTGPGYDGPEVRRAMELLVDRGEYVQIQALKSARYVHIKGSDIDGLVRAVAAHSDEVGCYFSLNPIKPGLFKACTNNDILYRRWMLVDLDARRPKEHSADSTTDAEKAASRALADSILDFADTLGWPEPVVVDSGNNWHLLYRIDLPADDESKFLIKKCLSVLASKFDNEHACIDKKVYDARRICKVPGTMTRKGIASAERPWRMSRLAYVPGSVAVLTREAIEDFLSGEDGGAKGAGTAGDAPRLALPVGPPPVPVGATAGGDDAWTVPVDDVSRTRHLAWARRVLDEERRHVSTTTENRNEALYDAAWRVASVLWIGAFTEAEARYYLEDDARAIGLGSDGDAGEIRRAIDNGFAYGVAHPRRPLEVPATRPAAVAGGAGGGGGDDAAATLALDDRLSRRPLTDMGNGERLAARHIKDIRYVHKWKSWLVWDGRRWKPDDDGEIVRRAKHATRRILAEAAVAEGEDRKKALASWAFRSESKDRLGAMMALAASEPGIPIDHDSLDADPWLFNCQNGTIDLRTGELRAHARGDLMSRICPYPYDTKADCPNWLQTLRKVFRREDPADTEALVGYWQRLCGYAATGLVTDHVMPVAYGTGSNGKTTVLGTLISVFGPEYAMKASSNMFMSRTNEAHPTEMADLYRRRLVVAMETEEGRRLNETRVKELTGGDSIRARKMYEDNWEFTPTHTLIMATNHRPRIRGTDRGIWRRLKLIPFTVHIDDASAIKDMPARLLAEAPGILAWCVRGAIEWRERGLDAPPEVASVTSQYREEQDTLGSFLESACEAGYGLRVKSDVLYKAYKKWCEEGNEFVMSVRAFGTAIQERGIEKLKSNGIWYLGIDLKPDREPGYF